MSIDCRAASPYTTFAIKVDSDGRPSKDQAGDRKRAAHTVQDWLRLGKRWSQIFKRYGYVILRFVPPEFSDERNLMWKHYFLAQTTKM